MNFSERSKYVFADSIKELMEKAPLDKITVTDIVDNCSTTRQTFYRNFKDKYDLVNWYFDKIVQKTIKQMGLSLTLEEGLVKKFEFMKNDKIFFCSAFSSSDFNNLLDYDYHCILEFYKDVASKANPLSAEVIFLLEFYCRGSMDMTAEWAKKGMLLSPENMAQLLIKAIPVPLLSYLNDLSEYHVTPS